MHLFASKDGFAFADSAYYENTIGGSDKDLLIAVAPSGTWYVGVKCVTTKYLNL